MAELTFRDEIIDQEYQDESTCAPQLAAALRGESTSARKTAGRVQLSSSHIIRRLDDIGHLLQTLTSPVARLNANRYSQQATTSSKPSWPHGANKPASTTTLGQMDERANNRRAGAGNSSLSTSSPSTALNQVVGTVTEYFPWPYADNAPQLPGLSRAPGFDLA
jgi:hypothetical protein